MSRVLLSRREILIVLMAQGLHGIHLRQCCREYEQYQLSLS